MAAGSFQTVAASARETPAAPPGRPARRRPPRSASLRGALGEPGLDEDGLEVSRWAAEASGLEQG